MFTYTFKYALQQRISTLALGVQIGFTSVNRNFSLDSRVLNSGFPEEFSSNPDQTSHACHNDLEFYEGALEEC